MTVIEPHHLSFVDPEVPSEKILFNVTVPLAPGQGKCASRFPSGHRSGEASVNEFCGVNLFGRLRQLSNTTFVNPMSLACFGASRRAGWNILNGIS